MCPALRFYLKLFVVKITHLDYQCVIGLVKNTDFSILELREIRYLKSNWVLDKLSKRKELPHFGVARLLKILAWTIPHGRVYLVISTAHHIQSIIIHPCPMLMPGVMEK